MSRRLPIWWCLAPLIAAGCGGRGEPAVPALYCPVDTRVCVADPAPTWVSTDSCFNSVHCPSGSTCDLEFAATTAEEKGCTDTLLDSCEDSCECEGLRADYQCEEVSEGSCRLAGSADYDPASLTDVFGSRSLVLDTSYDVDSGYLSLSWSATGDTDEYVVVACKLYGCPPVIEDCCAPGDQECRNSEPVPCISNYDRCVLASTETAGNEGSFDLGRPESFYEPELPDSCTYSDGTAAPLGIKEPIKVAQLLVGCLAYADTEVRAASALVPVEPARVNPVLSRVLPAADCPGAEGSSCYEEGADELGTCLDGACLPRCVGDADCASPGSCQRQAFEFVGVCVSSG